MDAINRSPGYRDLIADLDAGTHQWSVRDIGAALRRGYGGGTGLRFYAALLGMLVPAVLLAGYAWYAWRPGLLLWCLLAIIGFRNSSTRPTGIGVMACFAIAGTGAVLALFHGELLVLAGILPGLTWLGASAIKGVAMTCVEEKLRSSQEYFTALVSDGNLAKLAAADSELKVEKEAREKAQEEVEEQD
jgi:hypothetical protein